MHLLVKVMKRSMPLLLACLSGSPAAGGIDIVNMRTNYLIAPEGVDTPPRFSWEISSDERGQGQTAYRILVASDPALLETGQGDCWDSGKTDSETTNGIPYAGKPLASKSDYYWKVCVWGRNDKKEKWSPPAHFGTAMLNESDWTAEWITPGQPEKQIFPSVTVKPDTLAAGRYVRLAVDRIGLPVNENGWWRLQLAEMEIYGPQDPGRNLALNCPVHISNGYTGGSWRAGNLTDGIRTSTEASPGCSSEYYISDTPDKPLYIDIDLGTETTVDRVVLYPRNDTGARDDSTRTGSFPADFTIEIRKAGESAFRRVKAVTGQESPLLVREKNDLSLPLLGTVFETEKKKIKSAKLFASGQGLFEMNLNGQPVTEHVLEPGETAYDSTLLYAVYDVKKLLKEGGNTLTAILGNGMYNNPHTDRYQKLSVVYGPLRLSAQLEIVYADGSKQTVATGPDWQTTGSPYTFSSWYGGEDYDARLTPGDTFVPGALRGTGWKPVERCERPRARLRAQFYPPTTVVQRWPATGVTRPAAGIYVIDFGRNFAGQYEFEIKAPAGTRIRLYPCELLDSAGRADQSSTGGPTWETYTFEGADSTEKWGPKFVYHGFRYLEIHGLPFEPSPDMFTAKSIRAGNIRTGKFETSDQLLNRIDTLISRAIESNMYNSLTDCPHREKLGWLEVPWLMFNSIAAGYDVAAWMTKIVSDIRDSQLENGMVPSISPEHTVFWGPFRDDPTWGGAAVMLPWLCYETYGDTETLQNGWPAAEKLMKYLASRSKGNLLDHGLGEWGAYDKTTSVGFTESCTYYRMAKIMARAAGVLEKPEAARHYAALAETIGQALNDKYYHRDKGTYDSGSQAACAMALYYDIVPQSGQAQVLQSLIAAVEKADGHLTTGEIALKPLFLSLARHGRNDVAYRIAMQKTIPGYGYFLERGSTTLPEYWDLNSSQNHCMMGHLQGWFYEHLAGIRNAGVGYKQIRIEPFFAEGLDWVKAETGSLYGPVRSEWKRDGKGNLTLAVDIPAGTTAVVSLPTDKTGIREGKSRIRPGKKGIVRQQERNGTTETEIVSGHYVFTFAEPRASQASQTR